MNLDEIEDLIRRYLSAGIAVVLILVAPATGGEALAPRDDPAVVTVDPTRSPTPTTTDPGRDRDDGSGDEDTAGEDTAGEDTAGEDTAGEDTTAEETAGGDTTDQDTADEESPGRDAADGYAPTEDRAPSTGTRETDEPQTHQSGSDSGSGSDATGTDEVGTDTRGTDATGTDRPGPDGPADRDRTSTPPATPRAPADTTSTSTGSAPSAAERLGWGTPTREDDFASGLSQWELYEGPGHADQGSRSPGAVSVRDGVLTITGDASGTTGGMSWGRGQRYGRWEGRVRAPAADPSYNALLLLWPDAEDFPVGGEIDFMEMQDPARQRTDFFLHHGADDEQVNGEVEIDATRWHNWAVEWTPDAITAYVDGEQWFRGTDADTFPPGPMHLCIQLDWFPDAPGQVRESTMEVDWVRQYPVAGG